MTEDTGPIVKDDIIFLLGSSDGSQPLESVCLVELNA